MTKKKIGVSLEIEPQTFGFCAPMLYHACTHLRVALNSTIEHHRAKSEGVEFDFSWGLHKAKEILILRLRSKFVTFVDVLQT